MRCNDCNRFVAYGDDEIEVSCEDASYDKESQTITVSCEVSLKKTCAECGTELKEATFTIEREIQGVTPDEIADGDFNLDVTAELEADERATGKGRGRVTFYGVSGDLKVGVGRVSWTAAVSVADDDASCKASSMDDLQ